MKFKKPNFWDLSKPNLIAYLLLPFTLLIAVSNFILNNKTKKKFKDIKTICVGNIYVGGTGKTPTTIRLYQLLKELNLNVFTAKKFYQSQLDEINILEDKTKLIIGKTRSEIISKTHSNDKKILIFDDGLQDKNIDYDLKCVCFDMKNWIGNGCLIPSGPLRESLRSLKKYDVVFLKDFKETMIDIIDQIKINNKQIKIFETFYEPTNLKNFKITENFLIFSGIGNPKNFKDLLVKYKFNIVEEIIYPDHHEYTENDINEIKNKAKKLNAKIITTEKDFVKIPKTNQMNIGFFRSELKIKKEEDLINFLKQKIYA